MNILLALNNHNHNHNHNNPRTFPPIVAHFPLCHLASGRRHDVERSSAALRRRGRRLRAALRHERQSIAMALAEKLHHTSRGQRFAGARVEESDEMNNAMGQETPPPRAASTVFFRMNDDGDVLAARPTPLAEVRPTAQGSAGHRGANCRLRVRFVPMVQILDAPVLQMVGPTGGIHAEAGHSHPRAGYRSAQDLS